MTSMSDDDMAALNHQQELDRQQIEMTLRDVIEKAQREPITPDDAKLLAWGCGVATRSHT